MKNYEFSKNKKLETVLQGIKSDLLEYGLEEVKRYYKEFPKEPDYNVAQYGNLLVYYCDIFAFYRNAGYKTTDKFSSEKIWNIYLKQVGFVVRSLMNE